MGGGEPGCCSPRLGVHSAGVTHTSDAQEVSPDRVRSQPCGRKVNKKNWEEAARQWPPG